MLKTSRFMLLALALGVLSLLVVACGAAEPETATEAEPAAVEEEVVESIPEKPKSTKKKVVKKKAVKAKKKKVKKKAKKAKKKKAKKRRRWGFVLLPHWNWFSKIAGLTKRICSVKRGRASGSP